jgi:LacI family transcriptional regulator
MTKRDSDGPHNAPTIRHVADAAKVSRATVSRAFGQPNLLSRETVALVRATAERLGYVPNHTARALSTGRAGNIALVVPDITNPFFAAMMRGGQARARDQGYATFIGDSDEAPELEDMLLGKLAGQVDGFILASSRLPSDRILEHAKRRPFVLINRDLPNIPRLLVDTGPSYAQAVEHLASLGHRAIAYVAGPTRSWSNRQRYNATVQTARRLGVEVVRISTSRPSFEAGQASTRELVEAGVTAALAFDDVMAQGIMAGLAARGISVPGHFSIVGCDGILAPTFYPPLTSIEAHCAEAGEQAVDLLIEVMQGNASAGKRIVLATELVIRMTTVPPPSGAKARRHNGRHRNTHTNVTMEQS